MKRKNYDSDDSLFIVGANVCQCICRSNRELWKFNKMELSTIQATSRCQEVAKCGTMTMAIRLLRIMK